MYTPIFFSSRGNSFGTTRENDMPSFSVREVLEICLTFWSFFLAASVNDSFDLIRRVFSPSFLELPTDILYLTLLFIVMSVAIEWTGRKNEYALEIFGLKCPRLIRIAFYYALIPVIFVYGGTTREFIYFQY